MCQAETNQKVLNRKRYIRHVARVDKKCYGHPKEVIKPGEIYYKKRSKTYCSAYIDEQIRIYKEIQEMRKRWE